MMWVVYVCVYDVGPMCTGLGYVYVGPIYRSIYICVYVCMYVCVCGEREGVGRCR